MAVNVEANGASAKPPAPSKAPEEAPQAEAEEPVELLDPAEARPAADRVFLCRAKLHLYSVFASDEQLDCTKKSCASVRFGGAEKCNGCDADTLSVRCTRSCALRHAGGKSAHLPGCSFMCCAFALSRQRRRWRGRRRRPQVLGFGILNPNVGFN